MASHTLGSRLEWQLIALLGLALTPYVPRHLLIETPAFGVLWVLLWLACAVWSALTPLGYANEEGIHYRKWFRKRHVPWQDVVSAEWLPRGFHKKLCFKFAEDTVCFSYRKAGDVLRIRNAPEEIYYVAQKLQETGSPERFIDKFVRQYQLGARWWWLVCIVAGIYFVEPWHVPHGEASLMGNNIILQAGWQAFWTFFWCTCAVYAFAFPVGYADEDGIHYRDGLRMKHARWQDIVEAEWIARKSVLRVSLGGKPLRFKYWKVSPGPAPEAVDYVEQKLAEIGFPHRFVSTSMRPSVIRHA